LNHFRAFAGLKDLELLEKLVEEQFNFVIRLNLGSHPPKFWDSDGREVADALSSDDDLTGRN